MELTNYVVVKNYRKTKMEKQNKLERETSKAVLEAKRRMLEWDNPVEYVNNMYGCHPGDDGDREYFSYVFGK